MAPESPARRPSRDCVQNQITSATAVIATRRASDFQRAPGAAASAGGGSGDAISGQLMAELLDAAQGELSRAEIGHGFDAAELVRARLPKRRQVELAKLRQNLLESFVVERMQNDQSLAFFLVGNGGDHENLLRRRRQLLQLLFDLDVRDHFAADLA